ncbi:hypothetical protein D3C86_1623980 [compost metagenome]
MKRRIMVKPAPERDKHSTAVENPYIALPSRRSVNDVRGQYLTRQESIVRKVFELVGKMAAVDKTRQHSPGARCAAEAVPAESCTQEEAGYCVTGRHDRNSIWRVVNGAAPCVVKHVRA